MLLVVPSDSSSLVQFDTASGRLEPQTGFHLSLVEMVLSRLDVCPLLWERHLPQVAGSPWLHGCIVLNEHQTSSRSQEFIDSVLKLLESNSCYRCLSLSLAFRCHSPLLNILSQGPLHLFYPYLALSLLRLCARSPFISSLRPPFPSRAGSKKVLQFPSFLIPCFPRPLPCVTTPRADIV
jgi:hypothetical protein